jgi:MarR family transcriptional regulator for hemolysin
MTEIQERFATALHNCARAWRQALDRRLKYMGMSQASWLTIAVAAKAAEPLSQSELADRLAVEGATMVAMIDRLVSAGLVLRVPSTTDRRIKRVVLTADGRQLYDKVKAEADTFRHQLLSQLSTDKLAGAADLLEQIQGILERTS